MCGKFDWCLYFGPADNPTAAICSRIESPKRVGTKGAGWLHVLRDDPFRPERRQVRSVAPSEPVIDFTAMSTECYQALGSDRRGELASALGVSQFSLERLCVGWSERHRSYTFPMRRADRGDVNGGIIGVRLRRPDGRKLSVRGGREGLFLPYLVADDHLVICEGPTDTAAMLDVSFEAVGRPSCTGGAALMIDLVRDGEWPEVAIIADIDAPGQHGAKRLAVELLPYVRAVRIVTPPDGIKDAREWKRQGGTRPDILDAIAAAPALQITCGVREVAR